MARYLGNAWRQTLRGRPQTVGSWILLKRSQLRSFTCWVLLSCTRCRRLCGLFLNFLSSSASSTVTNFTLWSLLLLTLLMRLLGRLGTPVFQPLSLLLSRYFLLFTFEPCVVLAMGPLLLLCDLILLKVFTRPGAAGVLPTASTALKALEQSAALEEQKCPHSQLCWVCFPALSLSLQDGCC